MLPPPGTAQIFIAHPERLLAAAPGHAAWLSAEERARAGRYRRPADRAGYLATRVLVRGILAGVLGRSPDALRFEEGPHGKPSLRPPAEGLAFSASRTPAWVALAVTRGAACGIDVEGVHRPVDVEAIARRFAPAERTLLERSDPAERRRVFFRLWTLKEACLKANGRGLAAGLDACSFSLPAAAPPRASFAASLGENPERWSFFLLEPDSDHLLALALGTSAAPPPEVSGEAETCRRVEGIVGGQRPVR